MKTSNTKSKAPKPRKQMELGSMGQLKAPKTTVPEVAPWRSKVQRVLQKQMDSMTKSKKGN